MTDKLTSPPHQNFILYNAPSGGIEVRVLVRDETVWLAQKELASVFQVTVATISRHLKNIFESSELLEKAVVTKSVTTAADGKSYETRFYNLDAIIAVGYRVNTKRATAFRVWATKVLREYMIKGFALDDERLKRGQALFGKDYFDELLERIREIRISERRFYQKVTDLYALSSDYDASADLTRTLFASVQNKLLFAITGETAAERIHGAADATALNMGLQTWKRAPDGKILKSDVSVAKNYLSEDELRELGRIVSAYLDLAENRAQRGIVTTMDEWSTFLDGFLQLSAYDILSDKGKVSALEAKLKAEAEYASFRPIQDQSFESDFDRFLNDAQKLTRDEDE